MSNEPVYFAVLRVRGRDQAQIFYEIIPPSLAHRDSPLTYCTRLDRLPNYEKLITAPLWKLLAVYQAMKKAGKLPPQDRGGKPKTEGGKTTIGTGERYKYLHGWDRDAPAYPPLDDPAWVAGVGTRKNPPAEAAGGLGEGEAVAPVGEEPEKSPYHVRGSSAR